jgi:TatD DNase family protein
VAAEAEARGYFVSFAGNLTYPGADALRRAAAALGEDRILAETDSPFLTPQPFRGDPNRPSKLPATLNELARARGIDPHEATRRTAQAAFAAFPLIR